MAKDLEAQLIGRARFCEDRGEVKTPGLLTEAADQLERYRVALEAIIAETKYVGNSYAAAANRIARQALEVK